MSTDADCIICVPKDHGDWSNDGDMLELLEAGKNVVTSLPYKNIGWRGSQLLQRFDAAAASRHSTFYAGGVDPDVISERLVLAMSG